MLSGRVARFHAWEARLSVGVSTGSGGNHAGVSHTWDGSLETRFSPDAVQMSTGIRLSITGQVGLGQTARVVIPALGVDNSGGGASCGVIFDDLRLRVRQASYLWRLSWAAVRVLRDDVVVQTLAAGQLDGSGLGPTWVPLLGMPPLLTGSCFAGLVPPSPTPNSYSAWAETSASFAGGWRVAPADGVWWEMPVALEPFVDPGGTGPFGLTPGEGVSAATTWNGGIGALSRYDLDLVPNRQPFAHMGDRRTRNGAVLLAPALERGIVKASGEDTAAMVVRGGFPRTTARSERNWIDIRLPAMGNHFTNAETTPRLSSMLGVLRAEPHPPLEAPLTVLRAPWWAVNSRTQAEVAAT